MKFCFSFLGLIIINAVLLSPAWGKCSQEEMEAKARQVAVKMERMEKENDVEYRFQLLRFNNKASLLDENDIDAWCEFYDQMLLEL